MADFIFVKNLAGERDRFPAEWDRLWLFGRDNMFGADKKLLCPYVWREIRLLIDRIRPENFCSEKKLPGDLLGHDESIRNRIEIRRLSELPERNGLELVNAAGPAKERQCHIRKVNI